MNYTNSVPAVIIAGLTVGAKLDSVTAGVPLQFDDFKSHQQAKQLIQSIADRAYLVREAMTL